KTRLVPPLSEDEALRLYVAFLEDAAEIYSAPGRWQGVLDAEPDPDDPTLRTLFARPWRRCRHAGGDLGARLAASSEREFARAGLRRGPSGGSGAASPGSCRPRPHTAGLSSRDGARARSPFGGAVIPVLDARRMRAADAAAIRSGIPSGRLMENAAEGLAEELVRSYPRARVVTVVCGPGNNGGDGLAAARLLAAGGRSVSVFTLAD